MTVSVSFNYSTFTYSDLFQLGAAARYPHSSRPVATWLIRESLCIALVGGFFCTFVGFFVYPMFSPIRLTLRVVPFLLIAWSMYLIIRLRMAHKANRAAEMFALELSEDGVIFRDRDSEWRTRWKPGFEVERLTRYVVVNCGKKAVAWIPTEAFASPEAADQFVRFGRLFQAAATGQATHEIKGGTLEEV
jgi:hypothetical protein